MNADAERSITDLVARALQHNDERSQDMTRIDDITEQYARLLRNEGEATRALAKAREDLKTSREADVKAYADSALDGNEPAKRKELTVKHKAENLEVCALPGYVLAFDLLAANAVEAVQEGRRQLDDHELRILRGRLFPFTERPESLIDFVSAAFDASDRQHDADEHARYMKQGYQIAIKHVQEAKGLHERRGKEPLTFTMDQYPDLITDEDLSFFSSAPGRGAMQNASTGNDRPWPGSIQDLAENSEPQATPA